MAEEARNAQYQRRGQEEAEKKRMAEEEQKAASPDAATKEVPRSKRGGEEGSKSKSPTIKVFANGTHVPDRKKLLRRGATSFEVKRWPFCSA